MLTATTKDYAMTETIYDDDMECLHIRAKRMFKDGYRVWHEVNSERQLVCCACAAPGLKRTAPATSRSSR